jgi:hypothetical protein
MLYCIHIYILVIIHYSVRRAVYSCVCQTHSCVYTRVVYACAWSEYMYNTQKLRNFE